MGLRSFETFVRRSNILFALYIMLISYPIVGYIVVFLLPPDRADVFPIKGIMFLVILFGFGILPGGYLAQAAYDIGLVRPRWTIFSFFLYLIVIGALSIVFSTMFDLVLFKSLSTMGYSSHVETLYAVNTLISVPSILISIVTFPKEEVGSRFVNFVTNQVSGELPAFRSQIKFVRSNTVPALLSFLRDNLVGIFLVAFGMYAINATNGFHYYPLPLIGALGAVIFTAGFTKIMVYVMSAGLMILGNGQSRRVRLEGRFWMLYGTSIGISTVLLYYQFLLSSLSLSPVIFYSMREVALAGAVLNVQIACFVGCGVNIAFCPLLSTELTRTVKYLLKFWKYSQLEHRQVEIHLNEIPKLGTFQMFVHAFIEIVAAVTWTVFVFPGNFSSLVSPGSLALLMAVGGLSVMVYVFLDLGYRGVEVNGVKIGPKLLHKGWTVLTIVGILRQLISPSASLMLGAIPVALSAVLGFTLGFLSSYQIAAARIQFVELD